MKNRKFLVTNMSEGSICVTGRTRIDIPGMCRDLPLSLPENTASQTISRLKRRYPLLKIREAQENLSDKTPNAQNAKTAVEKEQVGAPELAPTGPHDGNDSGNAPNSGANQASSQKTSAKKKQA